MEENIFSELEINSETRKKEVLAFTKKRYLYEEIKNTPKGYFTGISGLRGIGKTTMLLQLANESENSLYFSADSSNLRSETTYGVVKIAIAKGYKNIFIDEIHYKKDWQQDIKTIYDEKEVRIFFSGSSAIEIKKGADLSRRAIIYHLEPLSFREYLIIKKGFPELNSIAATDLFNSEKLKKIIVETSKFHSLLQDYYKSGGLMYPSEDQNYFYKSLENALEKIIHADLEYLRSVDLDMENNIYRLLEWVAISPAGEVNYSSLSSKLGISKPTVIKIIEDLVKIGVIKRTLPCGKDLVRKEPKLYLAFPFREYFNYILSKKSDVGSLREEFFVNHVLETCYLKGGRGEITADFLLAGKVLEIGGEGKSFYQNPDFIVKDAVIIADRIIPLYLIGFLY
ncbi:MAG: AAA family ATPase [Candidatus Micrarchaeota archaeon]